MYDTDGLFLQALIDAGADIDSSWSGLSLADLAIQSNNLKTAKILIKNGAIITHESNYKKLPEEFFFL
jgi:hypothetical protein